MSQIAGTQSDASVAQLAARFFKGVSAARDSIDANYIRPFAGIVRVEKCKLGETRGHDGFFVIECTALEVWDGKADQQTPGKVPVKVGEALSHMLMVKHEPFLPNARSFFAAAGIGTVDQFKAMGDDQFVAQVVVPACSSTQACSGIIIGVDVNNRTSQKRNQTYTRVNWNGEIDPVAALTKLKPETIERFYPNGALKKLAQEYADGMKRAGYPMDVAMLQSLGLTA